MRTSLLTGFLIFILFLVYITSVVYHNSTSLEHLVQTLHMKTMVLSNSKFTCLIVLN